MDKVGCAIQISVPVLANGGMDSFIELIYVPLHKCLY